MNSSVNCDCDSIIHYTKIIILILIEVFILNLAKKGKNPAQFSNEDEETILDIVIKLAGSIRTIIEFQNSNNDYIEELILNTNKNQKRTIHTITSLMVLQENKDVYLPKLMREEVVNILDSLNRNSKNIYSYHMTKICNELERDGLFNHIKTKKRIKEAGFSKSYKEGKSDEGGFPSIYLLSPSIKQYDKVLKNKNAVKKINQYLQKYGYLKQFYYIVCESFMKMFISNSEDLRQIFKMINSVNTHITEKPADFSNWDNQVSGAMEYSDIERKELCNEFVNNMIENPNSISLFFVIPLVFFS